MQGNLDVLLSYLDDGQKEGRLTYQCDYAMTGATTFRIGGLADVAIWPHSADEIASLTAVCRSVDLPFVVIGNGSNLLFDDDGYRGAVILTTSMNGIRRNGICLTVECGVPLTRLASYAAKEGLGGLAFAYGIPGTLGGGVFMNAGAYGGELMNVITSVSWYDPDADEFGTYVGDQNAFGYRESIYQRENKLILSAELSLTTADPDSIRAEMDDYMQRRKDKQPLEFPSAGSAFKRYPGYFTAQLIDEAGLKGYSVGGAQVSEKHAGFIINRGGATCDDVLRLIDEIKAVILQRNGIEIEPEIRYIPCPEKKG